MKNQEKEMLKKELRSLFKSMDFISNNFLKGESVHEKYFQTYFNIYQQLALAWEFLGFQCRHWDGYREIEDKKETCKICGKVKGVDDYYYLLPRKGIKKLGAKLRPNSKKTFKNKKEAEILNDTIDFYGATLNVDVHNAYESRILGEKSINMADERIVRLKESGIECHIDQHLIYITMDRKKKKLGKEKYGGFPWEIKRDKLKNFPVIFDFDEKYRFLGLTILR
jgi:hypothetical protein